MYEEHSVIGSRVSGSVALAAGSSDCVGSLGVTVKSPAPAWGTGSLGSSGAPLSGNKGSSGEQSEAASLAEDAQRCGAPPPVLETEFQSHFWLGLWEKHTIPLREQSLQIETENKWNLVFLCVHFGVRNYQPRQLKEKVATRSDLLRARCRGQGGGAAVSIPGR